MNLNMRDLSATELEHIAGGLLAACIQVNGNNRAAAYWVNGAGVQVPGYCPVPGVAGSGSDWFYQNF
jgi:hypothetical protein